MTPCQRNHDHSMSIVPIGWVPSWGCSTTIELRVLQVCVWTRKENFEDDRGGGDKRLGCAYMQVQTCIMSTHTKQH